MKEQIKSNINDSNNLKNKAVSSTAWGFLDKGSNVVVSFIIGIVLARLLPPSDFGVIGLAMIVVGFGQIFVNLGLGPALIHKQSITERHVRVVFTTSVIAGILLMIIVYVSAPITAAIFNNQNVISLVKALSIIFVIGGFQIPSRALLIKRLDFRHIFYVSLGKSILYGIVAITLALLGFGVWSLVIGNIFQRVISFLGSYWFVRHSLKPLFGKKEIYDLAHFGSGITLSGIFSYFALKGDYFMIGRILGTEALGLYTKAYNLMQAPTSQFVKVLADVLFPTASKIQNDDEKLERVFLKTIKAIAFVTMPICLFIVIISPDFIIGLYGEKWEGTVLPLQILAVFGVFRATYSASAAFLRAKGWVYGILFGQVFYGISMLLGVWFSANWYGLVGASFAVGCAISIMWCISMELNVRSINIVRKKVLTALLPSIAISIFVGLPTLVSSYILTELITIHLARVLVLSFIGLLSFIFANLYMPQIWFQNLPSELLAIFKRYLPNTWYYFIINKSKLIER